MFQSQRTARLETENLTVRESQGRQPLGMRVILPVLGVLLLIICALLFSPQWTPVSTAESSSDAFVDGPIFSVASRIPGVVTKILVDNNTSVKKGELLVQLDASDVDVRVRETRAALSAARAQAAAAAQAVPQARANYQAKLAEMRSNEMSMRSAVTAAELSVRQTESALAQARQQLKQSLAPRKHVAKPIASEVGFFPQNMNEDSHVMMSQPDSAQRSTMHEATLERLALERRSAENAAAERLNSQRAMLREMILSYENKLAAAKQGLAQAKNNLLASDAVNSVLRATRLQIDGAENQAKSAAAMVEQAEAAFQGATLQASYTRIRASADGIIQRKSVAVGERVQPGQPLFAILQSGSSIVANFSESQASRLHIGQKVEIQFPSFPSVRVKGRIVAISAPVRQSASNGGAYPGSASAAEVTVKVPVVVAFQRDSIPFRNRIMPGMSAIVDARVH